MRRRGTSGLIIDAAAAAMDEGMETCSGDILGDEEEVEQVDIISSHISFNILKNQMFNLREAFL